MKIASGRVLDGKIVVGDAIFAEGSTVTVLAADADESFEATPEEESKLLEALRQREAGDVVDGDQLLRELRDKA